MATEANIQEAVCLKKGEREENALTSESFEEKVTELPGNQVKQLESSSLVATTVYTPLETGKPTDESGIFFQALSVTMVVADEHSHTPESYKATKQIEPEEKTIDGEVCGEDVPEKSEPEVGLKFRDSVEQSKKEAFNVSEKNQGDSDGVTSSQDAVCEDLKETTEEHAAIVADFKVQDLNETPKEFVKEETDDKAVDPQEASEQRETGSKDTEEQKYEESVKKIEQDEEIKPYVETEKREQTELVHTITSDAYISTKTSQVETTEHEETKQDVNVVAKDQDEDFVTRAQEVTFEGGLQEKDLHSEDNEHEVVRAKESTEKDADVCVSTQTALVKESIKTEEPDDEKAIDPKKAELEEGLEISDSMEPSRKETLTTIEKEQGDSDGVTSSQESPCVDVEETTTVQHAITAIDFKEQDLNEKPREFIKETEDKSLVAQEASEEFEKEAKEEIDQNPEESVMKIEKEEETTEIKPSVEIEKAEHEEEDTNDDGLKEKSDSPSIEEVCGETGPEKDEYEKEVKDSAMVTKDENEDEEKEQEVNMLDTDEGKVGNISAQDVTFEKDLQEKNHHNEDDEREVVKAEESIEKDIEVIKSSEKTEQQTLINDLPSDVCISTQTEPVEETTEKIAEETVERDDQTNKSEEGLLVSDSSSNALNENETERKDEDQEKEQEIYVTEKVQSGGNDVTGSENASNEQEQHTEEIKPSVETTEEKDVCISKQTESQENIEKTAASEENKDVETIKNGDGQTEKPESPLVEVVCETTRSDISESEERVKQSESFSTTLNEDETLGKEEKLEKEDEIKTSEIQGGGDDVTSSQTTSKEEIKETTTGHHDANVAYVEEAQGVISVPKEILIEEAEDKSIDAEERGQAQNIEETQPCLSETDLEETKEVEHKEEIISSTSLETSTEDTSNSEKEKAESEILPTKDLETGSEEQMPELVPKSEEPVLKEIDTHVDEEKETVTKEISSAEKTEVQGDGDDVTSSQNASNEDIQETIGEHDSTVTFVEEGECVSATPKEILIEEAEDKSIVAEEMPLELGQPNEQNVEEAHSCLGKITTGNPEDEIKKEDTDLPYESVEDTNDDIVKEETCTLKEEPVEEHTGQDEVSKEEVIDSNGTEVKPQEEITPSTSLETSTEDASISQEIKAEKETHEETIDNEEKNDEKAIEHEYEAVSREYDLEKKQEDVEETKMCEHATTNEEKGACITIQNESQEEPTKNEETAIERDGDLKESSVNAVVEEVCEENDLMTTETQGRQLSDSFDVKTREVGVDEDTEENKSSEEPKENMEQQGELNVITTDVCSSTQTKSIEETTSSEENNDVKTIENNDGQTEKPASPLDEVVCETTKSEIVESEEEVKQSDGFSTKLNDNETLSKEEKLEKEDEIKISEVEGDGVDVTSSQNASIEDIKETTIDQHDTTVVHVEEGHGVSALPKDILIEEAKTKSVDAEELLECGQPNEQIVEETHPCVSKIISEIPEDEIKKEDRDLSLEGVEDTNDNTAKEEKCTLKHEPVEEHSAQDEVSNEKVIELDEKTEIVEPQEDKPPVSLETPTEVTSNSDKEKQETESLTKEDLKTVSEVQIHESVARSEESVLKEECYISEKDTQLDEEKVTIMEEISSDEKTEQTAEIKQETVKEVCEETSSEKTELEKGLNETEIITFKEDDQEKDQEVNTSVESQGEDNITTSQNEVSEEKEDLKENNYHNEGDFIESGESVDEDTREFKSSDETKDTEHVITTNTSTQIEADEETIEKDEKNEENEIVDKEENLEKEQEDIKETNMGEHATTVTYFEEEQSLSTITNEVIGEAEGDQSVFAQEKTKQYDGENVEKEQKAEEHDDEIKPSVETTEEKDACISTQIESHVEPTKNEENTAERDGDQKENPANPLVKEVCEEGDLTKTESEERQLSDSSDVKTREYVNEDTKETKSSDEIKEKVEQQGVLNVITADVSSSTQTQNVEKTTGSEENKDEETIEHDEKPESPVVEVVCEERSEIVESKEVVKQSDSFSTTLNENEARSKEEKLEKEDEIKTAEVEGDEVEVTSSQDVSYEDIKETIDHAAHVEEEQGVRALPKEILIEKAEDKSIDIEETSLELGQPNEQNAEETLPCPTKSISDNPEDEIKKEDKDLSHESIEDTNGDTKEARNILKHEPVEEHNDQDQVSKEKVTDLHETTEVVEPQEDITPSISLETSTEDTSNLEKKKAEVETLPIEDLETVSEVQTPELVPTNSEESVLKKECFISETETLLDEEKEATTEKISSDEASEQRENEAKDKIEQPEESVNKPVSTYSETIEESIKEEQAEAENNKKTESELEAENQADITEDRTEMKDEAALTIKVSNELEQTKEQNVEETKACLTESISEKTEDNIIKDEDLSHDSTEHINDNITKEEKCLPDVITKELEISTLKHEPVEEQNNIQDEVSKEKFTDLNEPLAVEPQEDITPSGSLETSIDDTSNSDKAKAVSENLPLEDPESVSEVHASQVMPESEDLKMKEECLVSETETYADEENRIATKQISSDENLETHGSTQQPENSYSITEENVTQLEQTSETNSLYESKDMKEEVTQENQLNSTESCSEMETNVILTKEAPLEIEMAKEKEISDFKERTVEEDAYSPELEEKSAQSQKEIVHEISNSDLLSAEKLEVREVNVDAQIGQEDLQGKDDISCVSQLTNDAPVKSVDLSNIESTGYPSESEKLATTQAVDSDCDVQIPEVVADQEDSKVKEECIVLATTAEISVKEQDTKTNDISSASDKEKKIVTKSPTESDEAKSSDLIIEEKALTKEILEIPGELEPTSEPVIEEDQVTTETKPQLEQSDITSENITNDQNSESKLEHTSALDLEDGKGHTEEDVTLVPENETKGIENLHETTKNIILTDEIKQVAVETEKEKEKDEIIGQISEDDKCLTELDGTSTPDQKMEYSKPIPVENTEVTEVKAESQREIENIQATEDLSCLSKAYSIIETSKVEMHEDTEQTITVSEEVKDDSIDEAKNKIVPEDSKSSELQVNLPEIESTDTPSNGQDSMKPREDVSCVIQETTEEQGALPSQLADREILEEKDEEPISELQTFSEDQKSINERCIEEEVQSNFGVEGKDDVSVNKPLEDVTIDEVLLEDKKAKESKSIKDTINEEAKLTQLTSDTDVFQIEKADSRPDELLETKQSVEDTEDAKFTAENLSVKDETITVIEKSKDDSEVIAYEFKRLEDTMTDKEKETLDKTQVDDSITIYDPILSSTKQDTEVRSEESRDHIDMLEVKENTTGYSEIATEVVETVPECKETSAILANYLPEASPKMLLAKPEDKIVDVVSNVECSRSEPRHPDTKEATLEFINQENQSGQTKEADESIKDVIPVEDVKTSTREPEVGSVDREVPSIMDATADKANNKTLKVHEAGEKFLKDDEHLKSTCDQSKPIEEGSRMKQEPLELDATRTLGTTATGDLKISQKHVPDDLIKVSQPHAEIPKYDVPACTVDKQSPKESTESKILTEKIDSSHEQAETVARSWTPEAGNLKVNTAVSMDQKEKPEPVEPAKIVLHEPAKGNSEVAENLIGEKDSALTKDQQVEKEETVKTDEEYEEEEDNEADETMGSCSDAPVMVEASKDMEVKAPKKSHNILSGVGSKVKHSIAKVKKAITGKSSSPTKSTSPKAKTQVTG